jgi:D-beta-D-heptose 7-phosphate kinase/D-beta-D-heptose 1-phosphate adenosyltransferase
MKEKVCELINSFRNRKVLVIGDAILDTYTRGTTDSISREAPVLVLNVNERIYQCGGAANTAINIAALGAETWLLTVVGKDAHSRELVTVLRKKKVHTEHLLYDEARTTIAKQRYLASSNILLRTDEGTASDIAGYYRAALLDKLAALYPAMDAIVLSDYGYGVLSQQVVQGMREIVGNSSLPLVVDAKDVRKYHSLKPTAIKPNYDEVCNLLKLPKVQVTNRVHLLSAMSEQVLLFSGARMAAVTLDTDGVLLLEPDKPAKHIPCIPRDSTKTIGAGDTFTSAFALALACKAAPFIAAEIAAAAAATVVQKSGTAVCTNDELMAGFTQTSKLMPLKQLVQRVRALKKQHKTIVFTNGCFDILHKGHITLLQQAKEAGDVLIVGVNSDNSIHRLKGAGRPINALDNRVAVLAGLQFVDYIVSFDETDAGTLIHALRPHVFVKGGNYTKDTIQETPLLQQLGCVMKIIPYIEDQSTAGIIDKIRNIQERRAFDMPVTQQQKVKTPGL